MADEIQWMEQLGNTFLTQQAEVMAEVQKLRDKAQLARDVKLQVTATTRAAPKSAKYSAFRPAYRRTYNYAPYRYAYNYGPYRCAYNYAPYSHYGPAPYHSDGY